MVFALRRNKCTVVISLMKFIDLSVHLIASFKFIAEYGRFAQPEKSDFTGRAAVLEERKKPASRRLVTLSIDCTESDAEPGSNQAVLHSGAVVSRTLSGAFGHFVGTGLALAFLPVHLSEPGTELTVSILGDEYPACVIADSAHDPKNMRLKTG